VFGALSKPISAPWLLRVSRAGISLIERPIPDQGAATAEMKGVSTVKFPFRHVVVFASVLLLVAASSSALAAEAAQAAANNPSAASGGSSSPAAQRPADTIVIPGPLPSFLRMAGISQEVAGPDVLPLLARNAFLYGHVGDRKTEFLTLAQRYVQLARELRPLAGPDGVIRVSGCADVGPLIQILGYKFERGCTHDDASLITGDAERAFLTVDSGFPLTKLEQSLQEGTPFTYSFPASHIPILYSERDWMGLLSSKVRTGSDLLDLVLDDENVDRLYSAISRLDPQTQHELYRAPGLRRLLYYGPVLDFYGSRLCIHDGTVDVPGGDAAEKSWQDLVGASPHSPGEFVIRLLAKDQGWLAAYFDALSRLAPAQQDRLGQGDWLKRLYTAYRSSIPVNAAATSVFPRNSNLLLLLTRLQWDTAGEPQAPGNLELWKEIFVRDDRQHHLRGVAKHIRMPDSPDRLLEDLVAYSNVLSSNGPAQIYLKLSAIDSARAPDKHMSADTVRLLAAKFDQFSDWYSIFVEFPSLDDTAITQFVTTADHITAISGPALRSNALGAFQADIGIWQILARQNQIPAERLNASWEAAVKPYSGVVNSSQLFEAARKSLQSTVVAAGGSENLTEDEIVNLLAGPRQTNPEAVRVHQELARRIRAVLDDQRLVSLDTLFGLFDGLDQMAHGQAVGDSLLPLAGALREFEMPRPIFTEGERVSWSPTVYVSRHAELQVRTDLTKVIKNPGTPVQLEAARARLAPFLRDSLVGLNYAYYEPPGAQVLHSNPLFVRSHDFAASSIQGVDEVWGAPALIGIGATAGGGAYLIGSLADLPYVLALTEEDFISPEKIQALIWRETVPELLVNAVVPRWWNIDRNEMHAAGLYQRAGEELLTASRTNGDLRQKVIGIFADRMDWGRVEELQRALQDQGRPERALSQVLPADTFYLEEKFREQYPDQAAQIGPASRELDELVRKDSADTTPQRLARDFGVPHPTLAESDSCGLLTSEPFPVSGGAASRLFGESWESNNLYWARLIDEKGYPPAMLNILIPELTRQMVANISATSIDDWPALLRAMKQTGNDFMQGSINDRAADATMDNKEFANKGDASR